MAKTKKDLEYDLRIEYTRNLALKDSLFNARIFCVCLAILCLIFFIFGAAGVNEAYKLEKSLELIELNNAGYNHTKYIEDDYCFCKESGYDTMAYIDGDSFCYAEDSEEALHEYKGVNLLRQDL